MHIIVHPTGRNSFEFSVPLKLRRAYTVLQIIQCPGSTPAEAPGVSKKIRTCTVNWLGVAFMRCFGLGWVLRSKDQFRANEIHVS